jgi:soluble lytic murein transglycosylase-like protein
MMTRRYFLALLLLALPAAPCLADLYAYIDEQGRAHFSDVRLDDRYDLFMKERVRTEPVAAAEAPAPERVAVQAATEEADPMLRIPTNAQKRYADMISKVAKEQKLDAALMHAVITVESSYNPRAKSPKGATGLMQLMPETAKRYGITDLLNPLENLRAGARYLRDLLALFNNNLELVIAAYNAGEGAVRKFGNAIPPYAETRKYVPRVLEYYEQYRRSH